MTNKQALRSKARSASAGEWIKESGEGWEAICSSDDQANAGFIVAHFEGPDAKANREFIQAANPATVLALLDELEAAEKRIAELEAREVTLPPTFWYEHDDLSRDVPVLDKRLVKKAVRAAGIRINGEG